MIDIKSTSMLVQSKIDDYHNTYRHPNLARPVLHEPAKATRGIGGWDRSHGGPTPGVYVVYAEDGNCIYIGKASGRSFINARLYRWLEKSVAAWVPFAHTIFHIELTHAFEAPSLEEYLIGILHPQYNTIGRLKDLP